MGVLEVVAADGIRDPAVVGLASDLEDAAGQPDGEAPSVQVTDQRVSHLGVSPWRSRGRLGAGSGSPSRDGGSRGADGESPATPSSSRPL